MISNLSINTNTLTLLNTFYLISEPRRTHTHTISSSFPVLPTQRYGYLVKLEGWGDVSHKSYLDVYVCIVPLNRQRIVAGGAADPGQ